MDVTSRAALVVQAGFDLSDDDARFLAGDFRRRSLDTGDYLVHEGQPCNALYIIVSGRVEAVTSSRDGRELVFRAMGPAAIIGELTIVDGTPRSAGIRAVEPSVVIAIGRKTFLTHAHRNPAVGLALAAMCARRARDLSQWVSTASFESVEARLSGVLLALPTTMHEGLPTVTVTQQSLGDRLGVSRETVNKWLRTWEREGIVRLGRSTVTMLDRKRIEARALS